MNLMVELSYMVMLEDQIKMEIQLQWIMNFI